MIVKHDQVKLWRIPDEGLTENLTQWSAELVGHSKKVCYIEWHPSASGVLLSAAADLQVN
jgi:coronin-2